MAADLETDNVQLYVYLDGKKHNIILICQLTSYHIYWCSLVKSRLIYDGT